MGMHLHALYFQAFVFLVAASHFDLFLVGLVVGSQLCDDACDRKWVVASSGADLFELQL